jgi:hypothetical protein
MSAPIRISSTETLARPPETASPAAFDRQATVADLKRLPLATTLELHEYLSALDCTLVEQLRSTEVWPFLSKLDWKAIESMTRREHSN